MFPTIWYAPTFYSRTYWPRPSIVTVAWTDPALRDFLPVEGESFLTVDAPASLVVPADPFIVVESR
jgi:hypothetical protein